MLPRAVLLLSVLWPKALDDYSRFHLSRVVRETWMAKLFGSYSVLPVSMTTPSACLILVVFLFWGHLCPFGFHDHGASEILVGHRGDHDEKI